MDLDPATGSYRLSATVPAVEANALRATLGIRPVPQVRPVSNANKDLLFVEGEGGFSQMQRISWSFV